MVATELGCSDVVEAIASYSLASIEMAAIDGSTAVHIAARNGHLHTLEVLHKLKANFEARDAQGRTALHIATSACSYPVIRKLLQLVCTRRMPVQ
jgi:ankyrin repeat protein